MIQEEEPVQTFADLGLTYLQAKIYVTLLKLGTGGVNVRKIALNSSIARQDVYRILPSLENLGLVEKVIAMPTKYRPLPLEDGLSLLMDRKTKEFNEMQTKAKAALNSFMAQDPKFQENASQFRITSARALFVKRVKEGIVHARSEINMVYGCERLRAIVYDTFDELQKAAAKNVKIRLLTTNASGEAVHKNILMLSKNPSFELRYTEQEIPVGLVIFDNKEVEFRTTQNMVPTMWTNNRNAVQLAKAYFNSMWK